MELTSGFEAGIVFTGVVAMLGMGVWLFFRRETNGEKSLFSKMMAPHEDEIENRVSVTQFIPSFKENSSKSLIKTQGYSLKVLNQRIGNSSIGDEREFTMKSHSASTIESQEGKSTDQLERIDQSSGKLRKKSAEIFSGQKTLAGVLVVDDDPKIRKLIRLILENDRYDVFEAEDGQTAIDLLCIEDPPMDIDAIITDLNMPKVDGFELIAYCQKEWPEIPLIVLTENSDVQLANSFMRQGIIDYLVKPIDAKKLTASVAHAIAQQQLSWA